MTIHTVYHGSNQMFDAPDLSKSKNRRDFGHGFYTTTVKKQAEAWAQSMVLRFGGTGAFIYEYAFNLTDDLKVKVFEGLTEEWLEMVKNNRTLGGIQHDFDVVIGPVANDNTFRTITLYLEGDYTAKQAIEQLRYFRPNNQMSLHTEKALSTLVAVGRETIG